jgi:antirestriction protein ArdC
MSRPFDETRPDLYARVTQAILQDLEQGVRPWTRPWSCAHLAGRVQRPRRHNGEPYNGVNVILLWSEAMTRGFVRPTWMTFRQALALGGHVRKGEHGSTVVYADRITRSETDEDGEATERRIPFLKAYTVFNVDQIDGLPDRFLATPEPAQAVCARIDHAERFFAGTGAEVRHGGQEAYYVRTADYVQMPPFERFTDAEAYYAVLAHECTHWTGHPRRLDRDFGAKRWGDGGYAREELVAELGAAFLCADLGLELTPRPDHAAYLASWLKALKADKRLIFSAAAHAQRAADHLHGLSPAP